MAAVEEIRQAAREMRSRAVAVYPEVPWSQLIVGHSGTALLHAERWTPAVAVAVAGWLDNVAERHVFIDAPTGGDDYFTACKACYFEPVEPDEDPCPDVAAALKVARAYLAGAR